MGRRHANGGIKAVNKDSGAPLELESDEVIITRQAVLSDTRHEFNGKQMTNLEILSEINKKGGGVELMEKGGVAGSDYACRCSADSHSFNGEQLTERQILEKMEQGGHTCGCVHEDRKVPHHLLPAAHYQQGGQIPEDLSPIEKQVMDRFRENPEGYICLYGVQSKELERLVSQDIVYCTGRTSGGYVDVFLTDPGRSEMPPLSYKAGGKVKKGQRTVIGEPPVSGDLFKGLDYAYANAYELNRAIETLLDSHPADEGFTSAEQRFLKYYSGYGGLQEFGATGAGILYEYFTPEQIAVRMWGLAYKYGYNGTGAVLEPSCGTGEFFNYAPDAARKDGYEINPYSARICRILHPDVQVQERHFEELFIKNRDTVRGKVTAEYDLVIGNPPYGAFQGKFAGMGEKSFTRASNYIDYFIFRGLDLLVSGGLLIFIIGAEVAAGGIPFLKQQANPAKEEIAGKAELLDAYRLPNGVFARTDVLTDIIVLKKI